MTTRSSSRPSRPAATDDYTYEMQVHVPAPQIIEALTDDTVIGRWWTAVTRSERHGNEVRLFVGGADSRSSPSRSSTLRGRAKSPGR